MTLARIEGGVVAALVDLHEDAEPGHDWRPVVHEYPNGTDGVTSHATIIEAEQVRFVWQVDLDALKARYRSRVDVEAEAERARHITPGAGMALTYQEKFANAQAVDDLGETAANALTEAERDEQFPVLSASVGIEAETLWDCAQAVIERYEAFADLARAIERERLSAKRAIAAAETVAEVEAAYEAITWPV